MSIKPMVFPFKTMRSALSLMCFSSFCLLAAPALAEEADKTDPNTSSDYLQLALKHHFDLKVAVENHRSAIEQKESEVGPYDAELSEMVFSLGKTLQTSHRYSEAITAYKRSLYLNRVNNGVYSLTQAPMLRGVIESYAPLGGIKEISDSYDQLLWIHVKTYGNDDPRLIPLLAEISQWHLGAYAETGNREDVYHLSTAFELYSVAVELSSKHNGPLDLSLVQLLRNMAITCYYLAAHQQMYPEYSDISASPPFGYRPFGTTGDELMRKGSYYLHGRTAQSRILDIIETSPDITPIAQAQSYTDMGDWYLLFGRYQYAIKTYQLAHRAVEGNEHREQVLTSLFGSPTMLPNIDSKPLSIATTKSHSTANITPEDASAENASPGQQTAENAPAPAANPELPRVQIPDSYVNLSIDVTEQGKPTNLQVEEVYPEDTEGYGSRAKATIRSRKFRPRFEDGLPVLTNAFPIRVLIPHENS
jgi:tetratricopeptide (TPR) repeat protein